MDTVVEDMACKVIYDAKTQKGYIILPNMRMYCVLPDDMLEELQNTGFSIDDGKEADSIEEYDVTVSGRPCHCEQYNYADGSKKVYYFYNEELVRMDDIEKDGVSEVYTFNEISSNVDDSLFVLPKGYIRINLSWLSTGEE